MTVNELFKTLDGRENTEIMEYPNGARLYAGTARNIPIELLSRKVISTKLIPETYLGLRLFVE